MAFTKKFKKFVVLVVVTAAAVGGVYYMKVRKAEPSIDVGTQTSEPNPQSSTVSAPAPQTPVVQAAPAPQDTQVQPSVSEPVSQASDPSENRGMKFLLNQGKN